MKLLYILLHVLLVGKILAVNISRNNDGHNHQQDALQPTTGTNPTGGSSPAVMPENKAQNEENNVVSSNGQTPPTSQEKKGQDNAKPEISNAKDAPEKSVKPTDATNETGGKPGAVNAGGSDPAKVTDAGKGAEQSVTSLQAGEKKVEVSSGSKSEPSVPQPNGQAAKTSESPQVDVNVYSAVKADEGQQPGKAAEGTAVPAKPTAVAQEVVPKPQDVKGLGTKGTSESEEPGKGGMSNTVEKEIKVHHETQGQNDKASEPNINAGSDNKAQQQGDKQEKEVKDSPQQNKLPDEAVAAKVTNGDANPKKEKEEGAKEQQLVAPGKDGHDTPVAESQQPKKEETTLETLVASGSICHKQEKLSDYLKEQLKGGALREIFDPQRPNQRMERCRQLVKNKPTVCKAEGIKRQRLCLDVKLTTTIAEYLTYGVCTVEAALNQMYHKRYRGAYVSDEIAQYVKTLQTFFSLSGDSKKKYGNLLKILELIQQLFLDAEKALVSPEVQAVLYKRWDLLDTIFCAVASGVPNDLVKAITEEADSKSSHAIVDLESFISHAADVFMDAYKPLAKLVAILEEHVIKDVIEIDKEDFMDKTRDLVKSISDQHVPSIPSGALDSMRQIPHAGLNAEEVQRVTSMISPNVSLVQRAQQVSSVGNREDAVSPNDAIREALLSLNIFKIEGNHIKPEIDSEAVKTMVREALLSLR
ncbi:uncharacterized protein BXIN_0787 [Babesia sp. Xinjiang]|uniref:uncharacterized protein n=1 Tax=Babesia sp. Xinjiang TaxID=462227 RepID=UPI000A263E26|nr:uncharacterized protein BXIN_0787 [Babesia sp. Xinjiang]ORM41341.1 hypothetical protein BXIN_0787 [Babesia sp. Xinjiang]